jgi:hypothetical protein
MGLGYKQSEINNLKCPYQNFEKNLDICRTCQKYTECIDESELVYITTNPGYLHKQIFSKFETEENGGKLID